jgi:hypothetical protein
LVPYGALDFAQQAGAALSETGRGAGGGDAHGQWTGSGQEMGVDSWDFELQPNSVGGYGVPWI